MQNNLTQLLSDSMTPKFAVSYLRVSSRVQAERGGGDDEGFSIPAQREANKRKAHSMGAIIGKEFVDRGASARSADRPELQKMLEFIKENKDRVDYVIVHKVDRLARNRGDDIDITRALTDANVQLVSASESIDNSPSGMLLHGIMSSIAEFYSQNLANEVKKGLHEKVRNGGSVSKAPIGYVNVRKTDDKGREERTVEIDPERAPLVKMAFDEYATGNWSLNSLAEHLADLGLATIPRPRLPGRLIDKKILHNVFNNTFYKGIITYAGAEYKGKYQPIVDEATWEKVQEILRSHINGERTRIHNHYLKSTVVCGKCGARLLITNAKSGSGTIYPYFVCSAKHCKRSKCDQKSVIIDEVAHKVEKWYERIEFSPNFRTFMQKWVETQIEKFAGESKTELERLKKKKDKLEREQVKLLQAHYSDAIPLPLLKAEQDRISKELRNVNSQMDAYQGEYIKASVVLSDAFKVLDDCGRTYRESDDYDRRCLNQAIFKQIKVYEDLTLAVDYAEPFATILNSDTLTLKKCFEQEYRDKCDEQPKSVAHFLNRQTQTTAKPLNFFGKSLSKDCLVEIRGFEPLTFCLPDRRAPSCAIPPSTTSSYSRL